MKEFRLLFLAIALFLSSVILYSCQDPGMEGNDDTALIEAIQNASGKTAVEATALPTSIATTITDEYEEDFIASAAYASQLGYEVDLTRAIGSEVGEQTTAYFNTTGEELTQSEEKRKRPGDTSKECHRKREKDCFQFVFPVSLIMPDNSQIDLNSKEDWPLVKAWYESNPDLTERASFVYPITLTFEEDETLVINSEEELMEAKMECREGDRKAQCFRPAFPFTLTMPDGTQITLNAKEDHQNVRAWYEANPDNKEKPEFNFPITIEYRDGSSQTIDSQEAFEAAKEDCQSDTEE